MKIKVSVIGAGNMGGAVARGLAESGNEYEVMVSNPSVGKLEAIRRDFPQIMTTCSNRECASGADVIVLGVKPWKVKDVIGELRPVWESKECRKEPVLVSLAAGIDTEALRDMTGR